MDTETQRGEAACSMYHSHYIAEVGFERTVVSTALSERGSSPPSLFVPHRADGESHLWATRWEVDATVFHPSL